MTLSVKSCSIMLGTCTLLFAAVLSTHAAETYLRLDSCRQLTHTQAVHDGKAPLTQAYDGQGVIVGVIDGGMQYNHPTFRDAPGMYVSRNKKVFIHK